MEKEPFLEIELTEEQLDYLNSLSIEQLDEFFQELNKKLKELM